jgi:arylsulfatase A-like enzyme
MPPLAPFLIAHWLMLAAAPAVPVQASPPAIRPNIVLIMADDLGWTDLGVYGSRYYETPRIDSFAAQGIRFTNAYANPNCAPTRAALQTGRYGPRTGVYTVDSGARGLEVFRRMIPAANVTRLALDEVTFAERFRDAGYATAHIGKWHLGGGEYLPTRQGYDVNVAGNETGSPKGGYFSPYENPQLPDGPEGEYLTDRLASEAIAFLRANRGRPLLLSLSFNAVHQPIEGKPELIRKYKAKPPAGGHGNPDYAAMVESLDVNVGRVLDALDELRLAGNTIVIFYSDNGGVGGYRASGLPARDITDNSPLRGGKGMLYEGGIRVPLVVRHPARAGAGGVSPLPVMCVDFFPTLLELAGLPEETDREIDGVSFADEILGRPRARTRPPIYWHFPGYLEAGPSKSGAWRTTPAGAVRQGKYKLIEFFETGAIELYDLERDIGERNNVAPAEPATVRELTAALAAWRTRLKAPMPVPK